MTYPTAPGPNPTAPGPGRIAQSAPAKRTERPHPLTPVIRGWVALVAIVVLFARQFLEGGTDNGGLLSLGVGVIVLIVVGIVLLSGLAGFFSWYFTKFVIDDEEIRVETGALFRNSRRVAFARIQSIDLMQPMSARIFGLAELRIEAGAGDRGIRLRYLKRDKADQFRHYLLSRAQGQQASIADATGRAHVSALTDLSSADRPIVTVGPGRLVAAFLLSSEWLITVGIWLVILILTLVFNVTLYALPGLIPLAFGAFGMISRRVFAQFHFTLAESVRGLRISRGLTNLTSQSIPVDRIQGIRISQSLLWRPFGWFRVDIDVLGSGSGSEGSENRSESNSVLLPAATWAQVSLALDRILPGFDLNAIALHRSPTRARIVRPIDAGTFRYGWDDRVIVSRSGILVNDTDIVPHGKAQSVRLEQGPLQRLLKLASVHVDTPKGPVNLIAHHIDPAAARALALSELDRARAARARAAAAPLPQQERSDDRAVLQRFGLTEAALIGEGCESRVFALDGRHVLRIYRAGHEAAGVMIDQLRPAYDYWGSVRTELELPRILDRGEIEGRYFSVDRRMAGTSFSSWLRQAPPEARRPALLSYLDSAFLIQGLPVPDRGWARLFGPDPRTFPTLAALIHDQLQRALLRIDHVAFPEAESWARQVVDEVSERHCEPRLVHADYFPGNTYASGRYGQTVVRGVGDFSPHTLVADPIMDVAGAAILMELETYGTAAQDARWLAEAAAQRVGPDEARWFEVYRRYYAIYFGDDPAVISWSRQQLSAT